MLGVTSQEWFVIVLAVLGVLLIVTFMLYIREEFRNERR